MSVVPPASLSGTGTGSQPEVARRAPVRWDRRAWLLVTLAVAAWSFGRAGYDFPNLINSDGWGEVGDFFSAMASPDLSGDLLRLTAREAAVTVSYALLGTALSLVIGLAGGVLLAERVWAPMAGRSSAGWWWRFWRVVFAVPRSMHEVVFGLVLVNILGLNPLVAVLSIGIPFGAVTAKVFAELLDDAPREAELALRASGAGRVTALVFGAFPHAMGDLLSYSFYRFECAIRSAAVLGIVGAGGLGVQLRLSFDSLRYDEVWTMLWALVLISGLADFWSSKVRKRQQTVAVEMHVDGDKRTAPPRDRLLRWSALLGAAALPVAWWRLDIDITTLWGSRARRLGGELVSDAWPPELGAGGLGGIVSDSVDTVALAVLAALLAWTLACGVAFVAARSSPARADRPSAWFWSLLGGLCRGLLLLSRSVPPPVWAFLAVLVFLPGLWPGVVALALYNLGVLGRLQSEVVENLDHSPSNILRASGASSTGVLAYATVPAVAGRFVALGLYRWEVAVRETVMVGVVGAAGLGRRLDEQISSFHYSGILSTLMALLLVTLAVDFASAAIRRTLR